MKSLNEWSKKDLMGLPDRDWQDDSRIYDSLLLLSTRKKHDSGWAIMAIIGVKDGAPIEIACQCADDIDWKLPSMPHTYIGQMRTDCCLKSGAIHFWFNKGKFRVGTALSSTDIYLEHSNDK